MFGFASSLSISFRRGILPNNVGQQHRHVFKSARTQQASRFSMAATSPPGPVGFIGLGVMGLPMAANIANKYNAEMVVWNRSPNRAEELLDAVNDPKLITIAPTPAAVVQECSVTYSMLSTPAASRAVLHDGENAALDALTTGKGFVDCSTLTESDMLATAAKVKSQGARFLEAPVSGSLGPAVQGTLIFLCAGDKTLYDEVTGALDVMGKRSVFLGVTGAGTRMKLVVNQIMGAALAALAEGIALSEAVDLRVEDLLSVLEIGATGNPMFKLKGPKMAAEERNYATNFPLEHALKDMNFAQQLGETNGVYMPVAASATELYRKANEMGLGREDFSAVMESVRALAAQAVEARS